MLLEALGSKKRLEILRLLSRGEKCVSEIMKELRIDGKTAKYHLDILERAGIVECKEVGKRKVYRLVKEIRMEISPPPCRRFIVTVLPKTGCPS